MRPWTIAVLAGVLLGVITPVAAQEVTFDDALALGGDAPDVRGAGRALAARESHDRGISDVTSATELQLLPGLRVLDEQDRGFEGQIGIAQTWSLAGLGGARRSTAEDERAALAAEERALALGRRLGAARAWLELAVLERQVALASDEVALAGTLVARVERAVEGGVLSGVEASEARAFQGEAELGALAIEGERLAAMLALADAMGSAGGDHLRTAGPLPSPEVPEHDALEARLLDVDDLPQVEAARLAAIAERTREVEIAAASGPWMQTAVQVYRESPEGLMIFGQLTFGLPLVDLAARERSLALEEAERRDATHEERVLAARRDAIAVAHEVEHSRREERTLREGVVPALDLLVEQRAAQLRAGETTVLVLLDAERRRVTARVRLVRAEGARRWAEVRAWLLLAERARSDRMASDRTGEP